MAKITMATLKSFIRKNEGKLFVNVRSSFNGMTDGVKGVDDEFSEAVKDDRHENTLGYAGVWVVGGSRDSITAYEDENFIGFHVYNCCGSFDVAVRKAV